jgi:hypothetical protein
MRGGCRTALHRTPTSSKRIRTTKNEPGIQPTPLHYLTGLLALAFICCSLLGIYWYTTSAHASSGSPQANGKTMSGQVAFAETETEYPSPTVTTTTTPNPSPNATRTTTPNPSPNATRTTTSNLLPDATSATTPSPTSTGSATPAATVQPSPTATGTQTPSPSATSISIITQGTGANQTPVSSPATTNDLGAQSSQGAHHPGNTFPFSALMIGLGSLALLGLLFIPGWMIVRGRLLSMSSPKLSPSRAASWSRTRISDQVSAFNLQDNLTYNALSAGVTTATPGLYTSSAVSRPGSLFTPGSNPPASLQALPTMADISVPNPPAFSSRDDATSAATSPASHTNPPADIGHSFLSSDSSYLAARIRQRRNELRATESLSAFQKQTPGELSAEITELSDPYLQSLIQLYNARGRM